MGKKNHQTHTMHT